MLIVNKRDQQIVENYSSIYLKVTQSSTTQKSQQKTNLHLNNTLKKKENNNQKVTTTIREYKKKIGAFQKYQEQILIKDIKQERSVTQAKQSTQIKKQIKALEPIIKLKLGNERRNSSKLLKQSIVNQNLRPNKVEVYQQEEQSKNLKRHKNIEKKEKSKRKSLPANKLQTINDKKNQQDKENLKKNDGVILQVITDKQNLIDEVYQYSKTQNSKLKQKIKCAVFLGASQLYLMNFTQKEGKDLDIAYPSIAYMIVCKIKEVHDNAKIIDEKQKLNQMNLAQILANQFQTKNDRSFKATHRHRNRKRICYHNLIKLILLIFVVSSYII